MKLPTEPRSKQHAAVPAASPRRLLQALVGRPATETRFCEQTAGIDHKTCNVGVCHADVGCAFEPTNEVDNPDMCVDAMCVDGVYSETHKNCFDGNPCTLDACYPLTGICVNPPAEAGGRSHTEKVCVRVCALSQNGSHTHTHTIEGQ